MPKITFARLIERQHARTAERRRLHEPAAELIAAAKRSIFALQREDGAAAEKELQTAKRALATGKAMVKRDPALASDGPWLAALEEYCEALFFHRFLTHGTLDGTDLPVDDPETVVGGLSDTVGEFARYAVLKATAGERHAVDRLYEAASKAVQDLLAMDLTGNLRTKFDQSKNALRKLEEIRYELSRRP
jgi:predicted translin family RNA/ssDNA-binding protein